jgi:putative ABC transport system permease protein
VAAVVVTSAIGAGVERNVSRGIESMGVNLLVVRPGRVKRSPARPQIRGAATSLRLADAAAIAELSLVAAAAAGVEGAVRIKAGNATTTTRLLGTTAAYPAVRNFAVARGRFFDAADDRSARRVAVLGARVAEALFEESPVGRQIRIRGVPFEVAGVLRAKGVVAEGDEDNVVLIPVRTAQRRVFNLTWLNVVFVSARDPERMADAAAQVGALLAARHGAAGGARGERDFEIQNTTRLFAMQQRAAATLTGLTTGLAALALGVGGAGILALMLLSVKERTGEIGLRIAVGARPRDIVIQFLLESTALALGGWSAGLALGGAAAAAVALATSWQLAVPVQALGMSLGMAVVVGLGFGAVPARKAAAVPPMRALLAP